MAKIMVVDDDKGILDAIQFILEDYEHEVVVANDETSMNEQLADNYPDLLILDMLLSGSDGKDISKRLKSDKKTSKLPIVMISAHPSVKRLAEESGADDFLAKPFSIDDLVEKVRKYV